MTQQERLVKAMAPIGGLYLLLTLSELRKEGLSYLALYILEKTVRVSVPYRGEGISVTAIRRETGLESCEISRACTLLKKAGMVELSPVEGDRRERMLFPTARGRRFLDRVMAAAARRLWNKLRKEARGRRVRETTQFLTKATDKFWGPMQLTFFDRGLHVKPLRAAP